LFWQEERRAASRARQRGQQNDRKDADDRDYDQQLDQGETGLSGHDNISF